MKSHCAAPKDDAIGRGDLATGFLRASGRDIVDGSGRQIRFRGVNIGGLLNWEGFLLGHPATESLVRKALREGLGMELYARLSARLLDAFYGERDAAYLASLGLNCARIPINYRHFEDDQAPFRLMKDGLRSLDRVIEINARHGIYSIIDLHAAQGWQNAGWHSDNHLGEPLTWDHPGYQDRIVWLWTEIARAYRDQAWVAGYNLLNEPMDLGGRVDAFYGRLMSEIRRVDPNHLFVLDPNYWASGYTWDLPGEVDSNIAYDIHLYPAIGEPGAGAYPGIDHWGEHWDRAAVEQQFLDASAWIRTRRAPILVGEFGPIDDPDPAIQASRVDLAGDQAQVFDRHGAGWTYWTYKDIGVAGLVRVDRTSPWLARLEPFIAKKRRLASDYWGTRPDLARKVQGTFGDVVEREFPADRSKPWGTARRVWNLLGEKLLGELLVDDFVACFRGLSGEELDAMADSFRFELCRPADALAGRLSAAAGGSRQSSST